MCISFIAFSVLPCTGKLHPHSPHTCWTCFKIHFSAKIPRWMFNKKKTQITLSSPHWMSVFRLRYIAFELQCCSLNKKFLTSEAQIALNLVYIRWPTFSSTVHRTRARWCFLRLAHVRSVRDWRRAQKKEVLLEVCVCVCLIVYTFTRRARKVTVR